MALNFATQIGAGAPGIMGLYGILTPLQAAMTPAPSLFHPGFRWRARSASTPGFTKNFTSASDKHIPWSVKTTVIAPAGATTFIVTFRHRRRP